MSPTLADPQAATGQAIPVKTEMVVLSRKMKAVWGGDLRRWTDNVNNVVVFSEHAHAARAVGKLNKAPISDDAEVVTKAEALRIMGEMHSVEDLLLRHSRSAPQETQPPPSEDGATKNLIADFLGFDLNSILNANGDELAAALAEQKKAARDVVAAKDILEQAIIRLKNSQERVKALLAKMSPTTAAPPTVEPVKRGALKKTVVDALRPHSRIDSESVVSTVLAALPGVTRNSIIQTLSSLKSTGLTDRDDKGDWALTAEGKAYRPFYKGGTED